MAYFPRAAAQRCVIRKVEQVTAFSLGYNRVRNRESDSYEKRFTSHSNALCQHWFNIDTGHYCPSTFTFSNGTYEDLSSKLSIVSQSTCDRVLACRADELG